MGLYKIGTLPQSQGEYKQSQRYYQNNIVSYNNSAYILRVESSIGIPPTDETKWALLIRGIDNDTIERIKRELKHELKVEILNELRD